MQPSDRDWSEHETLSPLRGGQVSCPPNQRPELNLKDRFRVQSTVEIVGEFTPNGQGHETPRNLPLGFRVTPWARNQFRVLRQLK
jgi:hypothetical protein